MGKPRKKLNVDDIFNRLKELHQRSLLNKYILTSDVNNAMKGSVLGRVTRDACFAKEGRKFLWDPQVECDIATAKSILRKYRTMADKNYEIYKPTRYSKQKVEVETEDAMDSDYVVKEEVTSFIDSISEPLFSAVKSLVELVDGLKVEDPDITDNKSKLNHVVSSVNTITSDIRAIKIKLFDLDVVFRESVSQMIMQGQMIDAIHNKIIKEDEERTVRDIQEHIVDDKPLNN